MFRNSLFIVSTIVAQKWMVPIDHRPSTKGTCFCQKKTAIRTFRALRLGFGVLGGRGAV